MRRNKKSLAKKKIAKKNDEMNKIENQRKSERLYHGINAVAEKRLAGRARERERERYDLEGF